MTTEKLTEGCEMEQHSAGGWGSDKLPMFSLPVDAWRGSS